CSDDSFKRDIDKAVETIVEDDLHIACFPELSLCDHSLEYLRNRCQDLDRPFLMVVAGSFHRPFDPNQPEEYKNTMPVLVFVGRECEKRSYSKYHPFKVSMTPGNKSLVSPLMKGLNGNSRDRLLVEDITPDPDLLVISSRKFGNFGFVICKDFLPLTN